MLTPLNALRALASLLQPQKGRFDARVMLALPFQTLTVQSNTDPALIDTFQALQSRPQAGRSSLEDFLSGVSR